MPKAALEEAKDWTVLPADTIITVKVLDAAAEVLDGKYGEWTKLNVTFEILDAPEPYASKPDVIGSKIWGGVPFRFEDDPDNPLKNWTEAILGFDISGQLGFELDTDDWIGRKCRAVVRTFTKKNGKEGHGVDALLPLGSGTVAAPEGAAQQLAEASKPQATQSQMTSPSADDDVPF